MPRKTNLGQPPGRPERHTCIRIAPYDRVGRRKAIKLPATHLLCLSRVGDQREYVPTQAQVAAPERCEVAGDINENRTGHHPMSWRSFRSAGSPALTIAARSVATAFVLPAGIVAGSPSPVAQTSMTTIAR